MSKFFDIQPAVITTFALSDLMGQTQKCHAPPAVVESSRLIDTANLNNSAISVENRPFQTVPKQKDAMNTQSRRHDIYPHRYIDVPRFLTNLSHEKMNIVKLFM